MLLGLAEAKEILSNNAFDSGEWDCVDCLAGDCICEVEEVATVEDQMEQDLNAWMRDNVDDVDYAALNPDERAVYDAYMESETHAG